MCGEDFLCNLSLPICLLYVHDGDANSDSFIVAFRKGHFLPFAQTLRYQKPDGFIC